MSRAILKAPIVFVHGAFCGGWAFDAFRKPFEEAGYETHAPNLPHHERGADLEQLAHAGVLEYAKSIEIYARGLKSAPILVGHSLGGLIAQMVAARIETAALVLLAPSAPWGVLPTTLEEHGNSLGLALLGDYWNRPIAPDYTVARSNTLDRLEREDARRAFARFTPESGRAVREAMQWWSDHSMASTAPVYKIAAPILALAGGNDRVNPASTVRRIAARFPSGQAAFHTFPEMSHWLIGEPEHENVARLTLGWLAERAAESKPKRKSLFAFGAPQSA